MGDAMLCWRILHGMAPADTRIAMRRISCALEAGDQVEVEQAMEDSDAGAGLPPHSMVGFAGQLALRGHMGGAGRMLVRLASRFGASRLVAQTPSILSAGLPEDLRALGEQIAAESGDSAEHLLLLARLCFAFRNPHVAYALFARVSLLGPLDDLDRTAMLHAQAESNPTGLQCSVADMRGLVESLSRNPDALGMLGKIAMVAGELEVARECVRLAVQVRYDDLDPGWGLMDDFNEILQVLALLRDEDDALPSTLLERTGELDAGVPKVFLSGFGWSGSGALYDEIRGAPGLGEFEGAGLDAIINQDAESEVTFIQGPGGLGDIWKGALDDGRVTWNRLWDTFSLHVAGLSSIGYAQYKCAAAARNHVRRYGTSYTRPFRRFLEQYAEIRRRPYAGALHACLMEATESLCSMLLQHSGKRVVLFNNAIFGRDAEMFEIFRSRRAAVVYRDPRDVYVDRRNNDLNHWRTPAQLAIFYAHGLHRYTAYKRGRGKDDPDLREVSFERFVKNDRFRERVRAWLLGDLADAPAVRYFDPAISSRNIGIHVGALMREEQLQLKQALDDTRTLDQLSDAAWESVG